MSLPRELVDYIDEYRREHGVGSRSQVLAKAISALRSQELMANFDRSSLEATDPLIEAGLADGLTPSSEDD